MYIKDTRTGGVKKSNSPKSSISKALERIGMRLNTIFNSENFGNNKELKQSVKKLSGRCIKLSSNILYGMPSVKDCDEIINIANEKSFSGGSNEIRSLCQEAIREANDLKKEIQSAYHSAENQNGGELEHYGRLGMKWGMHIYGKEHVYKKSVRKLKKIDRKKNKFEAKKHQADTLTYKNYQKGHSWFRNLFMSDERRNEYINTAREYKELSEYYDQQKNRMQYIGERLGDAMDSVLGEMKLESFKPDDIYLGEKYCVDVIKNNRDIRLKEG